MLRKNKVLSLAVSGIVGASSIAGTNYGAVNAGLWDSYRGLCKNMGLDERAAISTAILGIYCLCSGGYWLLKSDFGRTLWQKAEDAVSSLTYKSMDVTGYEKKVNKLEQRLKKEIKGQRRAIEKIIKLIRGYYEACKIAKLNGREYKKGLIIFLVGKWGTGKTKIMNIIKEELNLSSFTAYVSDVLSEGNATTSNATVADRLLKPRVKQGFNEEAWAMVEKPMAKHLRMGYPTLYCFDEYDKMQQIDKDLQKKGLYDTESRVNIGTSLDYLFQNFRDNRVVNGVDVGNSILIATMNKTEKDFMEEEPSIYSRVKDSIVELDPFDEEGFADLTDDGLSSLKRDYKTAKSVDVTYSQEVAKKCGKFLIKDEWSSARTVDGLIQNLRGVLGQYLEKYPEKNAVEVDFDENVGEFVLVSG